MTCTVHKDREAPAAHAAAFSVAQRTYALQDANFNVTALVTRFTLIGAGTQDAGQWDEVEPDVWVWVETTGWYENRHRIYSATMARFGQAEPYGADYIDGANLYWGYGDNPGNRVDPRGLQGYGYDTSFFGPKSNPDGSNTRQIRAYQSVARDVGEIALGGPAQGLANTLNGAQDALIGILNFPSDGFNLVAWTIGSNLRLGYLPSSDWSEGLVINEAGTHAADKVIGGNAALTLATIGLSSWSAARSAAWCYRSARPGAPKAGPQWTQELKTRAMPGRDGGTSTHIIERLDGQVNSITHQVTRDGKIVHQHQTHIGKYSTERQFPDEWVQYPRVQE